MARKNDKILVIDLESTCWDGTPPPGQVSEIIEIGICVLDLQTLEREHKESILVQPIESEISPFCTQLTTLTPEMFAEALPLQAACQRLKKEFKSQERTWASWGDYDRRQFERVCQRQGRAYPFGITHLNLKNLYALYRGLPQEVGLDTAFAQLGWPLEGTHHRGHDDAWNIARILAWLLAAGRQ